ncbi:hypothetical protein M0657_004566 [Pyricularia oryzae]|nr:hypothetical protein M9X92_006060 [Pyricularia oryzae]KAI7924522.1 hypothetical protein M0657_004566 [Pyricularia oryzae]
MQSKGNKWAQSSPKNIESAWYLQVLDKIPDPWLTDDRETLRISGIQGQSSCQTAPKVQAEEGRFYINSTTKLSAIYYPTRLWNTDTEEPTRESTGQPEAIIYGDYMSAKVEPKNFDGAGIFTAISLRGRTSLNSEGAARNFSILHRIHWVQRPPPQQRITATGSLATGSQVWSTPPQYLGKSLDPAYLRPVLGLCFFHSEQQQPYQNSMHVLWAVDHKTPPPCRGLC